MDDQYLKDDDDDRSNESIPTSASDVSSQNGSELSEVATTDKLKSQKLIFLRAAEDGNLNQLQQLIQENPDFITSVRDRDGYTPLHRAAYNNHVHVCRWLVDQGADIHAKTNDGWEPLHCASKWAQYETLEYLLSRAVDVNARTNGNLTALHLAINSDDDPTRKYTTVKYLLSAPGVEMNALTDGGDTPLSLARRSSKEILELLQHYL